MNIRLLTQNSKKPTIVANDIPRNSPKLNYIEMLSTVVNGNVDNILNLKLKLSYGCLPSANIGYEPFKGIFRRFNAKLRDCVHCD